MNRQPQKTIVIAVVQMLSISFLVCSGCFCISPNKVVIDKQFLYDIEKAFQEEAKLGSDDKNTAYNTLWEDHYYELIYLVEKGDWKAIDVSISLIGQKGYPTCLLEHIELLLIPTFESDTDYFWKSLSKKDYDTQVKVLHVFDFHKPLDWDMEWYLIKYPKIKTLYDTKYTVLCKNSSDDPNE